MTHERGSRAESKNCEILLFPTSDRRFGTKVKCPNGRASFELKFSTVRRLTRVKCPGIARGGGGGMGGFGIDWYIIVAYFVFKSLFVSLFCFSSLLELFPNYSSVSYTTVIKQNWETCLTFWARLFEKWITLSNG